MNKSSKFVLSSKEFVSVESAENKVKGYFNAGQLKQTTKLYEVKEIYDLKLKFVKRKKRLKLLSVFPI